MTTPDYTQNPSPFTPTTFPIMYRVAGLEIYTGHSATRYQNRDDMLLLHFPHGAHVAGCFTRSLMTSAAVDWCRDLLTTPIPAHALVVNAGNANAFTGVTGEQSVKEIASFCTNRLNCPENTVFQASTGVIGVPMDAKPLMQCLGDMLNQPANNDWQKAAKAIMTTDTYAKAASTQTEIAGTTINISAIAKGSGMIAPDMATLLSFIVTDANLSADILQTILTEAVATSFNCISVDSDTSTSDTVLLFATGAVNHPLITNATQPELINFRKAVTEILHNLAMQVICDGEGIEKLIDVTVTGATDNESAKKIGLSIINSPLVKTAIAGEDPNWGRIIMAIGKSGQKADRDHVNIHIGNIQIVKNGQLDPDYQDSLLADYMTNNHIKISTDVGTQGPGQARVWGCDLTERYLLINGSYKT